MATSQSSSYGLVLNLPVAVGAAQTWTLGKQTLETGAPLAGTAALAIKSFYHVTHTAMPRYNGTIAYTGAGIYGALLTLKEAAKWADTVTVNDSANGCLSVLANVSGTYYWSSIIPKGATLTMGAQPNIYFAGTINQTGVLDENVGTISFPSISYANAMSGDGTLILTNYYLTSSLYFNVFPYGQGNESVPAKTILCDGATLHSPGVWGYEGDLRIGFKAGRGVSLLEQVGGTVAKPQVRIGGYEATWDRRNNIAIYALKGGTLQGPSGKATTLGLPGIYGAALDAPGIFRQTGGAVSNCALSVGTKIGDNVINSSYSHGLVDLRGGTFALRTDVMKTAGWNANASLAESTYRFRLAGGTLAPAAAVTTVSAQMEFQPGDATDAASTLEVGSKGLKLAGPVSGSGTIRKTGAGTLTIVDGSRLTGALDIREGTVAVRGEPVYADEADCIAWTGDSAAGTLEDGAAIESWPEANNGGARKAVRYVRELQTGETFTPNVPTLALAAFNGHAGVAFDGTQALYVPAAENPMALVRAFSVVVAFKSSGLNKTSGKTNFDWSYGGQFLGSNMAGYWSRGWGLSFQNAPVNGAAMLGADNDGSRHVDTPTGGTEDDKVHVIVATLTNGVATISLDGNFSGQTVLKENRGAEISAPLYIGFHSLGNGIFASESDFKTCSFKGTLAELRAYPNRVLGEAEQNALIHSLLTKYGGAADAAKMPGTVAEGNLHVADAALSDVPVPTLHFKASDLDLADGAAVETWTARGGTAAFVSSLGGTAKGSTSPTLAKGVCGGKPAVRFVAADKTALGLAGTDVPWKGQQNLAYAVVFRTTTDGVGSIPASYNTTSTVGSGILSSSGKNNNTRNAVSLTFRQYGTVAAHYHSTKLKTIDDTGSADCILKLDVYNRKPCGLEDGTPHIAVFSADKTDGKFRLLTDGHLTQTSFVTDSVQSENADLLMGSFHPEKPTQYFTGDIAEVMLFDDCLTLEEMRTLTESLARDYGTRPLAKGLFAETNQTARGLGVKSIAVAEGARLDLVSSAADPLVMTSGMSLSGAGTIRGHVRYGAGAALDLAATLPAITGLELAGATLKVDWSVLEPKDLTAATSVSGVLAVDLADVPEGARGSRRIARFDPAAVAEGTTFTIVSGSHLKHPRVRYNPTTGELRVSIPTGAAVYVR